MHPITPHRLFSPRKKKKDRSCVQIPPRLTRNLIQRNVNLLLFFYRKDRGRAEREWNFLLRDSCDLFLVMSHTIYNCILLSHLILKEFITNESRNTLPFRRYRKHTVDVNIVKAVETPKAHVYDECLLVGACAFRVDCTARLIFTLRGFRACDGRE